MTHSVLMLLGARRDLKGAHRQPHMQEELMKGL